MTLWSPMYMYVISIVLRCLGIPTRPVTNFESARDTNANRAIEFYYDLNDEAVEEKSNDFIWWVSNKNMSHWLSVKIIGYS